MAAKTGASRTARHSRPHLTPSVTTSRRGGHSLVPRIGREVEETTPQSSPGLGLISSARGVRLDSERRTRRPVAASALDLRNLRI